MATFNNPGPLPIFPGFVHEDVIAPTLQAMVIAFHSNYLNAFNRAPMQYIKCADLGTFVMQGVFEARVPMQLPGSLAFEPPAANGQKVFQQLYVAAPTVKSSPFELNFEWPFIIEINDAGVPDVKLKDYYGPATLPAQYINGARAHKARMLGDLRNVAYGTSAEGLTIPQPGFPLGLPLYTDGTTTAAHFSHPFRKDSARFVNLYLTAGKFDADNMITTQANMANIAHPTIPNLPAGYEVRHIKGPTWMRKPFYNVALASLQLAVSAGNGAAATTNIASIEKLRELGESQFIGASGVGPVTYWIDPTMDTHPLVQGSNAGKHMWEAVDDQADGAPWANFIAPSIDFVPMVKLLGDGSENAVKTDMIQMFGKLHAGVAAGWPAGVALYIES